MAETYQTDELVQMFEERFGAGAAPRVFFAPGRVNLIGEHTDYNGGHVFPCALTLGIYCLARLREDRKLRFYSENVNRMGIVEGSVDDLICRQEDGWVSYPKGVFWAVRERGYQFPVGMDFLVWGNIPNGAGLSSSAALEVLTGLVIRELYGFPDLTMVDLALIGQRAENDFCGMNCGIMDQFASAMGKKDCAVFLDTNTLEYTYVPVRIPDAKVVITNSKVKHSLVTSAYNDRRRECEEALEDIQAAMRAAGMTDDKTAGGESSRNIPASRTAIPGSLGDLTEAEFEEWKHVIRNDICRRRAKHAVYENQRTVRAVEALQKNDVETFGKLMNASHISLRDDYETSCPECDVLAELAWALPGVLGSRITGGGFGGCTVSLVQNDAIESFLETVGSGYREKTGLEAEFYVVEIGDGAHEL